MTANRTKATKAAKALAPDVRASADGLANLLDWAAGCVLIYGVLFGVGKLLLHETLPGVVLLGLAERGRWVLARRRGSQLALRARSKPPSGVKRLVRRCLGRR